MSLVWSLRHMLWIFLGIMGLVAILFWLYLNIQASMLVSAQQAKIQLTKELPTKIAVTNHLQTQAKGTVNTQIDLDRKLNLALQGKYLADLSFQVTTPVNIDIDYATQIKIETIMPLDTTTDLVYQNKLLPKFPLKLDIPVQLEVPFHLKRNYQVPINIVFHGPVHLEFQEDVALYIKHHFRPQLHLDDAITMRKIANFNATMYNTRRNTTADLKIDLDLPLHYIHP